MCFMTDEFNVEEAKTLALSASAFTDKQYLDVDVWGNDETVVSVSRKSIVKTRKRHECVFSRDIHPIEPGERARCEVSLIDGKWDRCYFCLKCLELELRDYYPRASDEEDEEIDDCGEDDSGTEDGYAPLSL